MPPPPMEFAAFYKQELRPVLIFLYSQGATWDDAWDAAQDAFTDALKSWEEIHTPRSWVRTAAMRAAARRDKRRSTDVACAVRGDWLPRPIFTDLVVSTEAALVMRMLRRLPSRQGQVIALTTDGFKPREIASILGISSAAARTNLRLARRALVVMLEQPDARVKREEEASHEGK
ncbi:hypothetical protein GCM10015536_56770 [Streptomyces griseomycini]|nr:hypothetical protein GCM10015536_56770 [Streptomyces griseomycini]